MNLHANRAAITGKAQLALCQKGEMYDFVSFVAINCGRNEATLHFIGVFRWEKNMGFVPRAPQSIRAKTSM